MLDDAKIVRSYLNLWTVSRELIVLPDKPSLEMNYSLHYV